MNGALEGAKRILSLRSLESIRKPQILVFTARGIGLPLVSGNLHYIYDKNGKWDSLGNSPSKSASPTSQIDMEDTLRYLVERPVTSGALALSLTALTYVLAQKLKESSRSKGIPAPPGPPRDFLIGNLRQFPRDNFYGTFCEWQKDYGECKIRWSSPSLMKYNEGC